MLILVALHNPIMRERPLSSTLVRFHNLNLRGGPVSLVSTLLIIPVHPENVFKVLAVHESMLMLHAALKNTKTKLKMKMKKIRSNLWRVRRASTVGRMKCEMIETFSQWAVLNLYEVLGGGGPPMNRRFPAAIKLQPLSPN
jgi:hypothetical protein